MSLCEKRNMYQVQPASLKRRGHACESHRQHQLINLLKEAEVFLSNHSTES